VALSSSSIAYAAAWPDQATTCCAPSAAAELLMQPDAYQHAFVNSSSAALTHLTGFTLCCSNN
jgi:hypothetical protein